MIKKIFILLLPVLALFFLPAQGQESWLYGYEQLSGAYYKPLKDSLKRKWDCPAVYKEKAIQKEYRNSWVSRADYLTNSLAENQYVKDSVLWPYLDGIMTQIVAANKPMISSPPLLLLDCSAVPNASAFGEHIITVNAGLVAASHTREELALYIAHELSHDILQHADNSMRKRAETISSDDYKESLKDVLSSKYQRYSRLMKIVDGYTFNRSRHSRYCESEADSLAVILLKKAQISFDASYFLNLDTVDETYRRNLALPLKDYFSSYQLTIPDNLLQKKAKGLSSRNYNFKDTLGKADSLKTHPDCKQRYETLKSFTDAAATHTAIPAAVQDQALQVSMWTIFLNRGLGHSFFRIFLLKDKQPASSWADFMFDNVLSSMLFSVSSLDRFHAIGIEKKEDVSKSYLELQTMLEQVTEDQLREWCNKRKQLNKATVAGADALAFRDFMNLLQQPVSEEVKKQVQAAAVEFRKTYANSPYLEYVNKITK